MIIKLDFIFHPLSSFNPRMNQATHIAHTRRIADIFVECKHEIDNYANLQEHIP